MYTYNEWIILFNKTSKVLATLTGLFLITGIISVASPAAASEGDDEYEIYSLVNQARSQNGLNSLTRDGTLDSLARSWSQQMAGSMSLSHDGSMPSQAYAVCVNTSADNVGYGYTGGADIFYSWQASGGHNGTILAGAADSIGVGVAYAADGSQWATMVVCQVTPDAPPPVVTPPAPVTPPVVVTPPAPSPTPTKTSTPAPSPSSSGNSSSNSGQTGTGSSNGNNVNSTGNNNSNTNTPSKTTTVSCADNITACIDASVKIVTTTGETVTLNEKGELVDNDGNIVDVENVKFVDPETGKEITTTTITVPAEENSSVLTVNKETPLWVNIVGGLIGVLYVGTILYAFLYLINLKFPFFRKVQNLFVKK